MKTLFLILISVTTIIFIASCNVDDIPVTADPMFKKVSIEDFIGPIIFSNYNIMLTATVVNDTDINYLFQGIIYNDYNDSTLNIGTIYVDTLKFHYNDTMKDYIDNLIYKTYDSLPVYGKICLWGWTGVDSLGIMPYDTTFYVFNLIKIINIKQNDTLDISSGLEIRWTPEIKNTYMIPIVLNFRNYGWHTFVKDTGYYKVPEFVFKYAHSGDLLNVAIGRRQNHLLNDEDYFFASSMCEKRIYVR